MESYQNLSKEQLLALKSELEAQLRRKEGIESAIGYVTWKAEPKPGLMYPLA